jgi:hypothetical protein
MSYKSQLYPLSSTGKNSWRLPIQGAWGSSPTDLQDMKLLRSWLVYDSEIQTGAPANRSWLLGFALVFGINASFWTGIGLIIARVW